MIDLPICPFCKNTGAHLCPDVAEPILTACTHKECPITNLKKNLLAELRAKVEHHAAHYPTDIFPDYSLANGDKPSIDQVGARMGRHMCQVFLEYIEEVECGSPT